MPFILHAVQEYPRPFPSLHHSNSHSLYMQLALPPASTLLMAPHANRLLLRTRFSRCMDHVSLILLSFCLSLVTRIVVTTSKRIKKPIYGGNNWIKRQKEVKKSKTKRTHTPKSGQTNRCMSQASPSCTT